MMYTPYKSVAYEVWRVVRQMRPAPTPNYQEAQRTRITVGVTPVRGSKNPIGGAVPLDQHLVRRHFLGRRFDTGGRRNELGHFSLRHLELRDDVPLVVATLNSGPATSRQLHGPEGGQHDELKSTHAFRPMNHEVPPSSRSPT